MSDFTTFDLTVTRTDLGLAVLDLNDHTNYIVADQLFGAQQTWVRQTAKSPFVDGEFTVHRVRGMRRENIGIQVLGGTQVALQNNVQTVLDAISQFRFQMTLAMDSAVRTFQCETADYTVDWNRSRWIGRQVLVTASVPIYPLLVAGSGF